MNIRREFERFGRPLTIEFPDGTSSPVFNGFVQPLRYKNKMYLYGVNTEIGYNSQGHYLYISPPEPDLTAASDGEYISCMGEKYRIDRAEKVYRAGKAFYIWAVVRVIVETE